MQKNSLTDDAFVAFQRGDLAQARALAQRLVESDPNPKIFHLLGIVECQSGQLAEGLRWLKRAYDANPADASVRVMLARALVDSGLPRDALSIAQPPAGNSPPELALWHIRAEAADAAMDWEASVAAWGKLIAARPEDWRAFSNRAYALGALKRWNEAIDSLKHALRLNPAELPLKQALASALARVGRFEESAEELRDWVEGTNTLSARILYARLLADLGQGENSKSQLDEAAYLVGRNEFGGTKEDIAALITGDGAKIDIEIGRQLAQLLERMGNLEALEVLLSILESAGIDRKELGYASAAAMLGQGNVDEARRILAGQSSDEDPVRWHWLMSRILDRSGEPAAAFREAILMNRSQADFDRCLSRGRRHIKFISELADFVTPEWGAKLETLSSERSTPAFVVGFPRSGTTLLDTFLMGHHSTVVLEEIPVINAVPPVLGDVRDLTDRSQSDRERARNAYLAELKKHAAGRSSDLVIDKLPLNMMAVPYLYSLFPEAPFVFVQRHPCDAVLSCFMQSFMANDSMVCFLELETAAQFYDAAMRLWTNSKEAMPIRLHTVVYEELIAEPEPTMRRLIEFLGLEWSHELLDHQLTAKKRAAIGTPSYNQVTQPLTKAPSGRWKRYREQLAPVLPILLPWAERLGYSD